MSANRITPSQRFSRNNPCPRCGGHRDLPQGKGERCYGWIDDDEKFVHCTRQEYADGAKHDEKSQTYLHVLTSDGSYRPWTPEAPTPINAARRPKEQQKRVVAQYDYFGADGNLLFQVVRMEPKGFHQRRPDGDGGWIWNLDGVERVPYRLPELRDADLSETIYVVEGEKDVDTLRAHGSPATCNPGGAGKWREEYNEHLRGRHFVILPDEDKAGHDHARMVARTLTDIAASVRILPLPGLGSRQDVSDWLAQPDNTAERLRLLADAAPLYEPDGESDDESAPRSAWDHFKERAVNLADIIENGIEPVEPFDAEEPDLLVGCVTCIIGGPEQGKTVLAAHKIIRALRADKRVLLIDEEMGVRFTAERLDAMGATRDDLSRLVYFPFTLADFGGNLSEMAATITEGIIREGVDLIVMDSVSKLIAAAGMDENSNSDATRLLGAWITPAAHVHGRTVLLLDHTTKVEDDGKYGRGAGSKLADVDVQFHIQAAVPPTRTSMGRLVLSRKKDRLASVPASVNYLAGGDGTGAFNVRIEGSDATTAVKVRESDRAALLALYGEHNTPLRFAEWQAALKRTKSTFTDSRRRLVNARLVEQRDDFYQVSTLGIEAIKDDLDILPKQPPLTDEKNAETQKSGTVTTSPDDPDYDPTRAQTKPRHDTLGTDAPKTNEPIHGKENAVGTDRYGVGTDVPIRTSQTEGGKEGTEGTVPLKGPYLPYLPPDAPEFDEDEAFDTAVRVEPEAEDDILKMWEWICGIHAGRMQDVPEEIRQAAQQAGFTFDAFAAAEEEGARLERFLDARGLG